MMRFSELLQASGLTVSARQGDADVETVTDDSRCAGPGSCFVAVRGTHQDGHAYISAAARAGCAAVVCEKDAVVPDGVPCATVPDGREAIGRLAQAIRGWPGRKLVTIGVTGTNGKSTVACLVRDILAASGGRAGLLGTIAYEVGGRTLPAATTTPDPVRLAEMCGEMVAAGMTHLSMEVSSHALDQRRTAGLEFNVAIFTNLSGDHLDYHKTMESYLEAKSLLFRQLDPDATAVLNRDEAVCRMLARATRARVLWYGLEAKADLTARIERIDAGGTRFSLWYDGREQAVATPLIGRHNVYNCLAAAGACVSLGTDLETIAAALAGVRRIPGRLERVGVEAPYAVFVDYAHTDDALANVLSALRTVTRGRLIVVFGCGGDRDRTKRPRMGRIAARQADLAVVTSDNPRSERPEAIIEEILAGLDAPERRRMRVEPDRRTAIALAVGLAERDDVVLIAGKGHEDYQIIGTRRIHFDDVEAAAEAMRGRQRT